MREQLITHITSVLAKAKGFDTYCEYSYWEGKLTDMTPGYPLEDGKHSDYNTYLAYPRQLAPTQSLLQKWLREVHNVDVQINSYRKHGKKVYSQAVYYDNFINNRSVRKTARGNSVHITFSTYEEALEEGLLKGLKLVK